MNLKKVLKKWNEKVGSRHYWVKPYIMYAVKWYQAEGLYVAQGGASANSLFFETKRDHQLFLDLWTRFMGNMAEMVHYSFTSVSWAIVFKTKSAEQIQLEYQTWRDRSKKAKPICRKQLVGEILSEHMRLFLSNYVPRSNRMLGKDGSRIKKRFGKFAFDLCDDYRMKIEEMERMHKLYEQKLEKYRANEEHYDEEGLLEHDCVYRSAKRYYIVGLENKKELVPIVKVRPDTTVLRSLLQLTRKSQNRNFPPNFNQQSPKKPPDN